MSRRYFPREVFLRFFAFTFGVAGVSSELATGTRRS